MKSLELQMAELVRPCFLEGLQWKSTFLSGMVPVCAVLHFLPPCPFNHYHEEFSFFRLLRVQKVHEGEFIILQQPVVNQMVSNLLGGAARPYTETDPFSFLTFRQPLKNMRCRVLGVAVQQTLILLAPQVSTEYALDIWHIVLLFSPRRYYGSHHAGHEGGEERTRGVYWGGKPGLRKYLASKVLA